jgi:hypothetical protein
MSPAKQAFEALVKELARLYGAEHNHDFQDELDALEVELNKLEAANVASNKPAGGQSPSKVDKVK